MKKFAIVIVLIVAIAIGVFVALPAVRATQSVSSVVELTMENRQQQLRNAHNIVYVVVCDQSEVCSAQMQEVEKVAKLYRSKISFYFVNIDSSPELSMQAGNSQGRVPYHLVLYRGVPLAHAVKLLSELELSRGFDSIFAMEKKLADKKSSTTGVAPKR